MVFLISKITIIKANISFFEKDQSRTKTEANPIIMGESSFIMGFASVQVLLWWLSILNKNGIGIATPISFWNQIYHEETF